MKRVAGWPILALFFDSLRYIGADENVASDPGHECRRQVHPYPTNTRWFVPPCFRDRDSRSDCGPLQIRVAGTPLGIT
jgi:hypothetical protein